MNPIQALAQALALLIGTVALATAAPPSAVDPGTIKDKVSITLGEESRLEFTPNGDKLLKVAKSEGAGFNRDCLRVKLDLTSASPIPPPSKGALRPFLEIYNGLGKTIHYHALVRMKGAKEFFELGEGVVPVPPGESADVCWGFGTSIEEVVLYQFTFSDKMPD